MQGGKTEEKIKTENPEEIKANREIKCRLSLRSY
jgi:hypothetical protein